MGTIALIFDAPKTSYDPDTSTVPYVFLLHISNKCIIRNNYKTLKQNVTSSVISSESPYHGGLREGTRVK